MKSLKYLPAAITFAVIAYIILLGYNSDMLFTAQDRSVFVAQSLFFSDCMSRPFGLMQYLGSYLTQLFYYPALGASALIAIWMATYAAGVRAFSLSHRWAPLFLLVLACLLASIVDVGYWIYCYMFRGYWFSQSLAYLVMLLLLCGFRSTPVRWQSLWYIVATAIFPLIGWTAILMAFCMFVMQITQSLQGESRKIFSTPNILSLLGLLVVLCAPRLLWYNTIYQHVFVDVVKDGGFPWFENSTVSSSRQTIPFFVLIGLTLLFALFTHINIMWEEKKLISRLRVNHILVTSVVAIISAAGVWHVMFKDYNFQAEMRMTQAAMADDWQTIVDEAREAETPSRTMVMLKNIALLNQGKLGEESFAIGSNEGIEINNIDSLNMNIMQIASPLVYYNHGYINYSIRWCMEDALGYGFTPFYLKVLSRCAKASGEKELENRYTNLLHKTMFHSDWQPQPPSKTVRELMSVCDDRLDNDHNSCEFYLLDKLSLKTNTGKPVVMELCLFYAMLTRDIMRIWPAFAEYAYHHRGQVLPTSYLEAYVVCQALKPGSLKFEVKLPEQVKQNYIQFMQQGQQYADYGMDEPGIADMMQPDWGKTYYWYNAFQKKSK